MHRNQPLAHGKFIILQSMKLEKNFPHPRPPLVTPPNADIPPTAADGHWMNHTRFYFPASKHRRLVPFDLHQITLVTEAHVDASFNFKTHQSAAFSATLRRYIPETL